ncbi:MAG: Eco57I restriction-modification methylase domain-containing protein, partial [Rhodobacteraceae bacterium]|nr:Eco57I restriction-modification methylase domain-containing protein [Paracoccaceae bacterium]
MTDTLAQAISDALGGFTTNAPLRDSAKGLLNALGYESQRTVDVGSVTGFLTHFANGCKLTKNQRKLFKSWNSVDIVFQFSEDEFATQSGRFETQSFDEARNKSLLFLAVDMSEEQYPRMHLAETTRAVNRLFAMPAIVLFRHGSTMTIATTHRREHKLDCEQDVLRRVTLVKDVCTHNPHRAHIEILSDLSFRRMLESGVANFDDLLGKWEDALDTVALNKQFYGEIFRWFECSVKSCRFPDDGAGDGGVERHVIRLITRILFIWFLKEKGLVPEELFVEQYAESVLIDHSANSTNYYRAILQNLFFGTLNSEIDSRSFRNESGQEQHNSTTYRYNDLMCDPDALVEKFRRVPYVNGGLFDCLDDLSDTDSSPTLVDAFTDNLDWRKELHVPASLFFRSDHGLFDIFQRYKFTIEESTPLDREVALDPELLGRVFENLLAANNPETSSSARNNTGSYYTPRPVVDFMVREVLSEALASNSAPANGDIVQWRERLNRLLDPSYAMDGTSNLFEGELETKVVVNAIAKIQTLDPAVGSGAFPMGILQALTLALRRLDPENTYWESILKQQAKDRAGEAFDTLDHHSRDERLREISATFEKYRRSDFGRKLYIIQNCIFGVDIQPIACQIAKLRFFISLVIEQDPDPSAPNLGIRPLPNLETRFVIADTLFKLKPKAQMHLAQTGEVLKLEKELAENRERYFHASNLSHKACIRQQDRQLRCQIAKLLQQGRLPAQVTEDIASWDPYDQNAHTNWFDPEHMFGVSDGFDVVVGNPPYIQLQRNAGRAANLYRDAGFVTFSRTGDIYQLFFERGCELLKSGTGTLAFITSNSWLKAQYGRGLRQYFVDRHTPLTLIEMGSNVFENAIVETAVLIVRNSNERPEECRTLKVRKATEGIGERFQPPVGGWGTLQPEGDRPWMVLSNVERTIFEKMEAVGTPLRDWDISIYYGIKTGYNAAFIVDRKKRDQLVAEDPSSQNILKPILRGRDITRYRVKGTEWWLIDTHNGYAGVPPVDVN